MNVMFILSLLMGICLADHIPQKTPTFFDNNTILAPNVLGEMVLHTIVDLTWEIDIPDAPYKINITGPASRVIDYINTNYLDHVWPNIDKLNTSSTSKVVQDPGPTLICNVFGLTPYPLATAVRKRLESLGNYHFSLGKGPAACAQAACLNDLQGRSGAIWWCNDGDSQAVASASEISELAHLIIPACAEFAKPITYTRGQVFDQQRPWNVIVTGYEKCR
ncbi:hypothetical protein DHEL01_v204904 [Diaporthe helianthi]|uniref:Secreted protein n=1 Tax=Diaporthe helianthi TaxID=158607 RepID=A0A2P5I2G9_DIAHE|nr:hypothetical protein DHEL01_v204904 [Diaporthe helianthi]